METVTRVPLPGKKSGRKLGRGESRACSALHQPGTATVSRYEGTGRSLSLKLVKDLQKESAVSTSGQRLLPARVYWTVLETMLKATSRCLLL